MTELQADLPIGFAEQVMDLQIKLQEQQSWELIQILSQMYRIAVGYYLDCDLKKANYFQKKMNMLAIKSLNSPIMQTMKSVIDRKNMSRKIKNQVENFILCKTIYLRTLLEKSEKSQKKNRQIVQADLNNQQLKFQGRMLKRVKSAGKL